MTPILSAILALLPSWTQAVPAPGNGRTAESEPRTLSLSFGLYQSEKATTMYKRFTPVLEALQSDMEARIGRPVDIQLRIFKTYDQAIDAIATGEIDFVRFGPASYITAKARQPAVQLLAMEQENGDKRFQGHIVVRTESPIRTLADLKGRTFAFGDLNSTIGRYLVQAELVKAGIRLSDFKDHKYLGRHDAVANAVSSGAFDAGSLRTNAFEKANEKGQMRILWTFENVTSPWIARAGLDAEAFDALRQCLLAFSDPSSLKELKISGFFPTSDEEYQLVREGMKLADEFERERSGP